MGDVRGMGERRGYVIRWELKPLESWNRETK